MTKHLRKHNRTHFVLMLSLLLIVNGLSAETKRNFIELQSGSMIGLVNLSYGWVIADTHHLSLGSGYVPELDTHHELLFFSFKYRFQSATTYKLKNIFTKLSPNISFSPFNFGVTGIVANNEVLFTRLTKPKRIPDNYYYPTGERYFINYQPLLLLSETLGVYADFSIIDIGLINYIRNFNFYVDNYKYVGLEGVGSYGIGIRMKF